MADPRLHFRPGRYRYKFGVRTEVELNPTPERLQDVVDAYQELTTASRLTLVTGYLLFVVPDAGG